MRYMALPVSFRWDEEFVARIDAARDTTSGRVSRAEFVRRAVEQALSEAKNPLEREQADPGVRAPGEGRSAAPAEQPERPNLRGAYEVAAKGGLVGELFQAAADSGGCVT